MNIIGITSILFGMLIIIGRGILMVAPATTLFGFRIMIQTKIRTRILGLCILPLGPLMIWAVYSGNSTLAEILMVIGWIITAMALFLLVIFPKVYMTICEAFLPSETITDFAGWRLLGLMGVAIGILFVYFGVLAL